MCGLFAFTGPGAPDPDILTTAARLAAARGPHGHGWATQPDQVTHHGPGTLDPADLATITQPRVIGHGRLATRGDHTDPAGLQPCHTDGHLIAHNGTIRNHHTLHRDAATDTLALTHLYADYRRIGVSPPDALVTAMSKADTPAWALLVLDSTGYLLAWRRDLPLWRLDHPTGIYYASRAFHPDAEQLPNDTFRTETPA